MWSLKRERKEAKEESPEETLAKYKAIFDRMERKANYSTGALILSYVVLRLPWMIFSEISGNDLNSTGIKTSSLLYFMKFNIYVSSFLFQVTIKKTLQDFKRTHQDNWQEHKLKFSEDQLSVMTDLLVSPNYYA